MGNFYKAVLPTLLISILFGTLGIVTHKTPNSTRLSTHWLPKIITLACLVIYTYAVVATLLDTNSQYISGSYYGTASSNIGAIASFLGQIAATYVILGFNFMYNSTIKTSLENIQRIDNKFEYAGHKLSYRNFYILQLTTITTGAIILMLLFFNLHLGSGKFTTAKEIIMQFPHIVMFLVEIQFSVFVWLVYCRILFVNDIIDNLTAIESSTGITFEGAVTTNIIPLKWKEYSIQHIINKIHLLMEIHSSLNDVALLLNKSFEFQILVCITIQFIRIVFSTFYSYYFKVITQNNTHALQCVVRTLFDTVTVTYFTVICHLTSKQVIITDTTNVATETGRKIHKLIRSVKNEALQEMLLIFSNQVFHKPKYFTACSLFDIDATLLFTMTGSVATYLLIMLQFQQDNHKNCFAAITT